MAHPVLHNSTGSLDLDRRSFYGVRRDGFFIEKNTILVGEITQKARAIPLEFPFKVIPVKASEETPFLPQISGRTLYPFVFFVAI